MRIISQGIDFDLPRNFETQFTKYNVFLTTAGEQSNPITLPPTPKNLGLVGYSNRIDAARKPITDIAVTYINGVNVRPANLGIHTADEEDGISCTIYLGIGDYYSKLGNTRLDWLAWPKLKSPDYDTEDLAERVQYLIDLLISEYVNPTEDAIFFIAPVLTSKVMTWKRGTESFEGNFYLNGFDRNKTINLEAGLDQTLDFEGVYQQTFIIDNHPVIFQKGYGMTPFLKLKYVLKFIFNAFGYDLDFANTRAHQVLYWHNVGVINNVADAIYAGVLDIRKLFADLTIKEFISKIETLYAGKFIVNEFLKKVSFTSYKYILQHASLIDLSEYLSSKLKKQAHEFTTIRLIDSRFNTDKATEDNLKTEDIVIGGLVLQAEPVEKYMYVGEEVSGDLYLGFHCVKTENVIHKNSQIIIDEKLTVDEEKSGTEIQLADFNNEWVEADFRSDPGNANLKVMYKTSDVLLHDLSQDGITDFREIIEWYTDYIQFKKNSNIPFTGKFTIPTDVFMKLNENYPITVNSQKLLIETLKVSTNEDSHFMSVEINLRTLREYVNR